MRLPMVVLALVFCWSAPARSAPGESARQPADPPPAPRPTRNPGPAAPADRPPAAARAEWTQLSLSTCGVDRFLAAHPAANGQGVVIAVMDTGVDPSIPGLTRTPAGEVKVIDVQDFTGDGDVELERVRLSDEGNIVRRDEEGTPTIYTPPQLAAEVRGGEARRWWFGTFDESLFVNADQADLNGNETTDDEFPVLVTALEGDGDDQALAFVDTNLDRSFADEEPLRNYKLEFDTFTFRTNKPEAEIEPVTFAVNIFLRQEKIVFHFDNGAHGTHVAGIAAGYRINNQAGFDGVAPGAKVMSLKIGHGGLGGISVTESIIRALRYAARFAEERGVPVVCNLSFGVESEIEGNSEIDREIDKLLRANPGVVFCTSAGNSGPGLSTIGTPAAASEAITVGALMAADTGRDVAGFTLSGPVVTTFSSRGGELDKPDLATPGWSTSTVPRWVRGGDFWSGTSMASPYAAGLVACLISHVRQQDPAAQVRGADVKRALWLSSRPVEGATALDQGFGVPDLGQAAELLPRILAAAKDDPVLSYSISTPSPYGYKGKSRAAYWRATWFPNEDRQTFTIEPVFAPTIDASVRASFTRQFELRSTAAWCRVPQNTIYLHAEQSARAFVEYDATQLTEPGLHVGVVEALADGLVAFRLLNTIIVPYRFTAEDNFTRTFRDRTVKGWTADRYFVAVPPGASAMQITLTAPEGRSSRAGMPLIFNPLGASYGGAKRLDSDNGQREVEWSIGDDLIPGVWEIPIVADRPDKQWPYELRVQFFGLHAQPRALTGGPASRPKGKLTVTNMFEKPVAATADGQIEGLRLEKKDKFKGLKDELTHSLAVDERCNRLRLDLEMTPEDYAQTTDIAVLVKDGDGEAVYKSAFEGRRHEATFSTDGKKSLELVIHAGFATADSERETPITVKIDQLFESPVAVKVSQDGESNLTLIPGVPLQLEYSTSEKIEDIPSGQKPVGYLRFRERSSNDVLLRVPLHAGG